MGDTCLHQGAKGKIKKLLAEVNTYQSKCESNGNVFWLGASTENFDLVLRDKNQNLVRGNFTNWNSPLFGGEHDCVYMKKDGNDWPVQIVIFLSCVLFVDLLEHQYLH